MAMVWRRIQASGTALSIAKTPNSFASSPRFSSSIPKRYAQKVGVLEFLRGIGKDYEVYAAKFETEIRGGFLRFLTVRTSRLKELGIPCKQRKIILSYLNRYRLGLWKPPASVMK